MRMYSIFEEMKAGTIKGLMCWGQNPAVGGPNSDKERGALANLDWLVCVDLFETETAAFWKRPGVVSASINTEVWLLPAAAKSSINPVIEAYANQLKGYVHQESWWRGYCPICGSKPIIGELRNKEGERFLLCSSCGFEWRFKRMMCPFCGNEDDKKHRYFYIEKETRGYRVDVCEKCRKYIKTIDTRELSEEVVLPIEDLGTLHLDILAQKEGYKRGVANMLSV